MKVLKTGTLPEDKTYQGTCTRCRSEVEFQRKEAEYHSDQREGDALSVACPICHNPIWVRV